MSFQLVPKSNDLERRNGPYFRLDFKANCVKFVEATQSATEM